MHATRCTRVYLYKVHQFDPSAHTAYALQVCVGKSVRPYGIRAACIPFTTQCINTFHSSIHTAYTLHVYIGHVGSWTEL